MPRLVVQDRTVESAQARAAVIELLAIVMEMDEASIHDGALLEADLGADSLAVVEVVFGIEERYDIRLHDDVVRGAQTVADLIAATTMG